VEVEKWREMGGSGVRKRWRWSEKKVEVVGRGGDASSPA
jgi:hypothetical protein